VKLNNLPRIKQPQGGGMHEFIIPADPQLHLIQTEIRTVRAALSLWGVQDIDVDNPKIDWTPETEEERKATDIFGFSMKKASRGEGHLFPVAQDLLVRSILSRSKFVPIQIPLEFYRRGNEDVHDERYIEAIYDFYFVFEYLFGGGKYDKKGVGRAFLASKEAKDAFANAQAAPPSSIRQHPSNLRIFKSKYQSQPIENVIETIIGVRGFLHHQSLKRKRNWNPAVQSEFKVDALFMKSAAQNVAAKLAGKILFLPTEITAFQATTVHADGGAIVNWVPLAAGAFPQQ
jgi:hypothetical protein